MFWRRDGLFGLWILFKAGDFLDIPVWCQSIIIVDFTIFFI